MREDWFDSLAGSGGIQGLVDFACAVGRFADVGTAGWVAFGIGDLRSGRWHGRETRATTCAEGLGAAGVVYSSEDLKLLTLCRHDAARTHQSLGRRNAFGAERLPAAFF